MNRWITVTTLEEIPAQGARVVRGPDGEIAIFRTADDTLFALENRCPHRGGPLSEGLVYEHRVACPLHDWRIDLERGAAIAPDSGCVRRYPVRCRAGVVEINPVPMPVATLTT